MCARWVADTVVCVGLVCVSVSPPFRPRAPPAPLRTTHQDVLPLYGEFWERYTEVDFTTHPDKYLRWVLARLTVGGVLGAAVAGAAVAYLLLRRELPGGVSARLRGGACLAATRA